MTNHIKEAGALGTGRSLRLPAIAHPWALGTARRWHGEILKHADDLATILTSECGKPLAEARAEIASGAASVEWMAEECRRVEGDVLQSTGSDRRMLTLKQPVRAMEVV
eukprot:1161326-Pelagomonas_calceolata.AAC.3